MNRQELETWLCGPDAPTPTPVEIAAVLGLSLDTIADTTLLRSFDRLRALRFTLAVLRDVYTDDCDIRLWLLAPRAELGERRALDLLRAGRIAPVEELAVREWHEPAELATGEWLLPRARL